MTIEAEVICDAEAPCGIRLTTLRLRYPRFIHAELMTHRVFSRNARSSRAIPTARLIEEVENDPVVPIEFGRNRKGMQASDPLIEEEADAARNTWLKARDEAVYHAKMMAGLVHKQHVNRLLEPFAHIDVLVTSTDWMNWFVLRDHEDAQPEIRELAQAMARAMGESGPVPLGDGDWHLPYIEDRDEEAVVDLFANGTLEYPMTEATLFVALAKVSAARCRRISYKPFDGSKASAEADLARFDEMVKARPMHASPMEHQAMATGDPKVRSGNFRGWIQFRQCLAGHEVEG